MSKDGLKHFISPSFTHEKLESPTYIDLVDVFEDRIRNWFLLPASRLLAIPNGQVAALSLFMSYFEGIEIYISGKDSKNKSKEFFARGFARVFDVPSHAQKKTIAAIYDQARCGFAHDGMFRYRVFFSESRPEALTITWPKKNENFDFSADVESIVINPKRFYECITMHFDGYILKLRNGTDCTTKTAFEKAVALKWALNRPSPFIGMSQEDWLKR